MKDLKEGEFGIIVAPDDESYDGTPVVRPFDGDSFSDVIVSMKDGDTWGSGKAGGLDWMEWNVRKVSAAEALRAALAKVGGSPMPTPAAAGGPTVAVDPTLLDYEPSELIRFKDMEEGQFGVVLTPGEFHNTLVCRARRGGKEPAVFDLGTGGTWSGLGGNMLLVKPLPAGLTVALTLGANTWGGTVPAAAGPGSDPPVLPELDSELITINDLEAGEMAVVVAEGERADLALHSDGFLVAKVTTVADPKGVVLVLGDGSFWIVPADRYPVPCRRVTGGTATIKPASGRLVGWEKR